MDVRQFAFLARQPSAAIAPRQRFWGLSKRGIALIMANAMFWQPLLAQAGGVVATTPTTTLGQAANGVPIVNIAAPNSSGLSHNQYQDYNVGSQGLILNNATNSTQSTQLGGIILGNPNLHGTSASTILNEVNGGNPSQLNGYTEVAGQSAHVIVANPYGVSCSGCGFINSPQVTLSTGKPILDGNGKLDHYQVDGGSVTLDGAGLNASNIDRFEIVTRSAKLNAELHANQLTIVTGRNDVDAQTLAATPRSASPADAPALAIDSSALGGMYAGAIKLVGTEAGVGVKLAGNLAASAGDIQLDVNGHLSLAQTAASGAVKVNAASAEVNGPVYAGTQLAISTTGDLNTTQNLAARDSINLSSGGQLTNSAVIEAGVNTDNSRNSTGDVSVTAQNFTNVGSLIASRSLQATVAQTLFNQGGTVSGQGSVQLNASSFDNQHNGRVLSNGNLTVTADQLLNTQGLISSNGDQTIRGRTLINQNGTLRSQKNLTVQLTGSLDNGQGLLSSEALLSVSAASLANRLGSLSSAGQLSVNSTGLVDNQGGQLVTDGGLDLHSASLDNSHAGSISGKGALSLSTGAFDNSHNGSLSGGSTLTLTAGQVTNQDNGRIASAGALSANVTGLNMLGGQLFSNTALTLDLNHGQLNNQNGLINAPILVLNHLNGVANQNGEISSANAFTLAADSLDNSNGKLLSNQTLTLRINQELTNIKGLIAAAALDAHAGSLDNSASGTVTSQGTLGLTVDGVLNNQNQGLINATSQLTIGSGSLNNQNGSLLGSGIALDFAAIGGDLNNSAGLITTSGQLTINHLRDLTNQNGEISSSQSFSLSGRTLDNTGGKLISSDQLSLNAVSLLNPTGLISGWQGLTVTGGSLDNHNNGTLSSRSGDVSVSLSGALLNSANGALVSQNALTVNAASLDNSGGILSSGTGQTLTVSGLLNNGANGLIDSGAALSVHALTLSNIGGTINAQQTLNITGTDLDNTTGSLIGNADVTLDLLGSLTNISGKLASAGPLLIQHASQINNQGGQLASQSLLTLFTGGLDNSNHGTVAASGQLLLTASGAVQNNADGLIYSQNADVQLNAASFANGKGTLQSQGALGVTVSGDIDNQSGKIIAQTGDLSLSANNLDSRGGVLSSLQAAFAAHLTGVLKNGYDLNNNSQGGITQAQNLNLTALGGIDNYGGRISAQTGDALITTADFDNRNGGLYATGKVNVTAHNFDNSGSNDGQIAGSQIDLSLSGALNNQLGIIESDSVLNITAASINNQTGKLRALGTSGVTQFSIGGLFDNRNGTIESANTDLNLGLGSLLNAGGSVLHVGTGTLGLSTANIMGAGGGSIVTRGGLTLSADTWANNAVVQAGRLTVNVNNFSQTAAGQLLASDTFTGSGGNWSNDGLIASSGNLALNLGGTYGGNGGLSSVGTLGLSAAQISLGANASITAGTTGTVTGNSSLTNFGRLTSVGALTVNTASLNNQGTLGSGASLRINAPTILNQNGLIFSGSDMVLRTDNFTNRYADVYSLGNINIAKDDSGSWSSSIANVSATIESVGDLTLAAGHIENRKDVFEAVGGLLSSYIGVECYACSGTGDLFSAPSDSYAVWVENYSSQIVQDSASSSITAGRNFVVNGGDLSNQASTLSAGNNLTLNLQTFTNQGASVGDYSVVRDIALTKGQQSGALWFWQQIMAYNAAYDPAYAQPVGSDPDFVNPNIHFWNSSGVESVIAVQNRLGGKNTDHGIRFGSIFVDTDKAGDFALAHYGDGVAAAVPDDIQNATPFNQVEISNSPSTYANAVVQAGGAVSITASQNLTNSVIREGMALNVDPSRVGSTQLSGHPAPTVVSLNAQLPPDLAQQQVNPTTLPGFSLPTGQNGLFRLSGQGADTSSGSSPTWTVGGASVSTGQHQSTTTGGSTGLARVQGLPSSAGTTQPQKYLIETNAALTDLKQFMSSDYMLSALGYNPDDSEKRLGDGLYEQRLVDQAIVARTGQAFIDGQTSNEAQLKYLMDNAIASKDALDLTVGVSLTSEQVAALTHDIVWMEDQVVDGQHVLVPVVYLAQADNNLAPNGALIQGSDVNLIAGQNLDNAGTLKATNNLAAAAGNDMVNSGLLQASGRLDLLAGNDLTNKAGGIIAGRDVGLTTLTGDVINERTVTTAQASDGYRSTSNDYADSAARITAANDLTIQAGRDVNNVGSVLQSGRDTTISAGRDVNLVSAQTENNYTVGTKSTDDHTTQLTGSVSADGDLSVQAGRDITAVASQITAKNDVSMEATENLTLSSAADEDHYYSKGRHTTRQKDHVAQVSTTVTAGGNVVLSSGQDMTLVSSNVTAGKEAYLVAGGQLDLLAAQNSDYSLYDMKKKSGLGGKRTQHDEVTDVKNIGSQIKTGGDLSLVSGGDQLYQNAKLDSGKDLTLESGGGITFEAVKDSHQESHDKSSNSWAWTSMESKGKVDETLRQSQLSAKGQTLISAVDGLHIDVKDINQQSISQTIDAMVQADPSMAWLKDVGTRNDVDWHQIKELHDSWDESHSGLGGPAMLIIIIIVTYFTAGAASGALGEAASATAGSSTAMSAGLAATATSQAVAAGWANAALSAALTSAASTAAVSTINNKGDLGAVLKDTLSVDNLKNYLVAAGTAGLTAGLFNGWTSTSTGSGTALTDSTSGALANTGKVIVANPGGLSSLQGIEQFTENQLLQNTTSALLNKALGRDGSLSDALQNSLVNAFTAYGFNLVGDIGKDYQLQDSGLAKIGLHALMGGLASVAAGGDFKTGALAAGVNEALVDHLASAYAGMSKEDRDRLLAMNSQLIGVLTTAVQDPTADIDKLQLGSSIAQSGTLYNRQLHPDEIAFASDEARVKRFADENGLTLADAEQELLRTAASMVDRGWNSVLSDEDGNTAEAANFLRAELVQAKNDHLFQVSLADYNNERAGLVELFKDKASLDKVLKNVALVDPLDYRTDAKYMQEVLNAKGEGSQEGFGLALEGAASGASKTALWVMGAANCPSCAAEDIENAWNSVLSMPEELRLKGYLDNLHIMQGGGADVIRGNESTSAAAGVGLGLAIDGGLTGALGAKGAGTGTAIEGLSPLDQATIDRILSASKGARPDPATYLSQDFIDSHLAQFDEGVTKFAYAAPSGVVGPPGGTFVMPKSLADSLINQSGGNVAELERLLSLDPGTLGANPVRIDVSSPSGLRMPSGNELGANGQWIPGGKTGGGIPEATIDPAQPGTYIANPIFH